MGGPPDPSSEPRADTRSDAYRVGDSIIPAACAIVLDLFLDTLPPHPDTTAETSLHPSDLFSALVDSAAWPYLRLGLHAAFFLVALVLLKRIHDLRRATEPRRLGPARRPILMPALVLILLFGAMLAYQATWQLAGIFRPEFLAFMQTYDRRQFNPAHGIERGRILDRRGEVLAYSERAGTQVWRRYPYGPAFAHSVGYSHPKFGAAGVEAAASQHLNGATPERLEAWGELGRQLMTQDKRLRGQDLVLTLDHELQLAALQGLGNRRGAVVLLRPEDGAILVLASSPSFDPADLSPALFARSTGQAASPLLNRATQGLYPPGSTFKMVLAVQALELGFSGTLQCPAEGYTTSPRYPLIRDHEYYSAQRGGYTWSGHGDLDLGTAFAESSNVFFAQLGVRYGHDAFRANLERLLFGQPVRLYPGMDRTGAINTSRVPRLADKDQYGLAQASIGQGVVTASPAHLALITAAVANRGLAMKPRLIASEAPAALAPLMSAATAERLSKMMRRVVTTGTGRPINTDKLAIAGKTGTAENPQGAAHGWFVGFAPAERPTLALAVLVEQGGYGATSAAPIARDLLLRAQDMGLMP